MQYVIYKIIFLQGPSVQVLGMTARATLHQIETLTYNITEKKILADLSANLKELYSNTYRLLPHKDGLVLRPRDQRQVTNMRRRVWKAKTLLKCSSLSYTKRKKRLPSSFRNRFGIKADRLRRANQVNYTFYPPLYPICMHLSNNCLCVRLPNCRTCLHAYGM